MGLIIMIWGLRLKHFLNIFQSISAVYEYCYFEGCTDPICYLSVLISILISELSYQTIASRDSDPIAKITHSQALLVPGTNICLL